MIKISFIGILTFLLTGNLISQVSENDFYEVLNQLVEINNVEILSKRAKSLNIENPLKHEFIDWCINATDEKIELSQIDSAFIMEQIHRFSIIKWEKKRINRKIKLKKKAVDYFTIPLFLNKKKDLIVIYHSQYSGPLAAEAKYELYQKIGENWKLINLFLIWFS